MSATTRTIPAVPIDSATRGEPCENCGAPVLDRYCGACGQKHGHSVHSVWHFVGEATEDLTHADSRIWRTLIALLFKPGFLTSEFLAGRRASYLPPIRLYLVLSVAFFLVLGIRPLHPAVVQVSEHGLPTMTTRYMSLAEALGTAVGDKPGSHPSETPTQRAERLCAAAFAESALSRYFGHALERACPKVVLDNGRGFKTTFEHNIPRAMFLFLPFFALIMKALYRRPPRYYVEHLMLCVHNHAFVFLTFGLYLLTAMLIPAGVVDHTLNDAVLAYSAWYFYRSMRRVYGQGRLLTFVKFTGLSLAYAVLGGLMVAIASFYTLIEL
jgi:hypothetical protein